MISGYYKIEWKECESADVFSSYVMRSNYKQMSAPTEQLLEFAIQNYVTKIGILNYHKVTKEEYESNTQI